MSVPVLSITGIRPAECAALLGGKPHGERLRAPCPVHGGSNPTALGIAQGRDRDGNPMTLLHCFAQDCPVEDICAAMGIEVKDLFCIHPDLCPCQSACATRPQPTHRASAHACRSPSRQMRLPRSCWKR